MSSSSNAWTVASKKGKPVSSPKIKKPFVETMPKIEPKPPVEESPTIYSVLRQDEERKEQKLEKDRPVNASKPNNNAPVSSNSVGSKKNPSLGKKAVEKKKDKAPVLEEALTEISISELESVLANDKVTFPSNPEVWLKDLVSLFNLKLDKVPAGDSTYSNKPTDYPACLLSKSLKSFILHTLSQSSSQTLKLFLDHCIETMMNDVTKGISSYGYHIFVQLLLHKMPLIAMSYLPTYLALLKDNINRPQRARCILWAVGQAGLSDLGNGLKVWLELMLPVLIERQLSTYAVQYLENLFRLHPSLKLGTNTAAFPKREFFKLFDELFSSSPSLTSELRAKMMLMYPKLKAIQFGSAQEATLHTLFSSFLSRCSADCSGPKKAEVLECLVTCLSVDKLSFSTWRQIYVKHLSQSSILLQYLLGNFDTVRLKMDVKLLRETVRAFSVTNDDLAANRSTSLPSDFNLCTLTCKELLARTGRTRFVSHWFAAAILVAIIIVLGYDIYSSGGFAKCRTYRALLAAGVIDVAQQAWNRLCLFSSRAWLWVINNVPVYITTAAEFLSPYAELCGAKLVQLSTYLTAILQPHCQSIVSYITQFVTWLNSKLPMVLAVMTRYIDWCLQTVVYISVLLYGYLRICTDWILSNVLTGSWSPDNILRLTSTALTSLQSIILSFWQWVSNLFS